ncbi:hypothetical protein DMX03_10520 [Pseudomonas koreensis]|nr:hypothetical protein DMX03_10520 [Pseudomonas koreensis]
MCFLRFVSLSLHPCGSEPARENGVSDTFTLNDTLHSRAGSLPQKFFDYRSIVFSSSILISRILNFWILPVTVIGNASTNLK